MKSLNNDALMVGVCALVISTCSLLLFLDFTSRIEAGDAEQIGTITFKKRVSQRKYGAQVIWEDIEQNAPVYLNDSLRTSEMSEAVVKLKDGTSIELDESSMIVLSESSGAININFAQGTMYARRGAAEGGEAPRVNIVSGGATVSIEQSDVKFSKSEDRELDLTVSRGTAVIKAGGEEKVLLMNQRAVISPDAREARIREVKLKLLSPEPNRFFITREPRQTVGFSWEPAGEVYFELSRERNFGAVVARRSVKGESVTETVTEGEYYWRLKSSGEAGGPPEYSDTRKIHVIADRPVALAYPGDNAIIHYQTRPPLISFSWGKNDIATGYVLEIAGDRDFTKKIASVTTGLTGLTVDILPAGTYFWRVNTRTGFGDLSYSGTSEVRRLVVGEKAATEKIELISPPEGAVFSGHQARSRGIIYSWKLADQGGRYELRIARDRGFTNMVHQEIVTGNFTALIRDYEAGAYYWKVRPVVGEGGGAEYTPARSFSVLVGEGIRLLSPVDSFETQPPGGQSSVDLAFAWTKSPIIGRYLFELSKDAGFTRMMRRETLTAEEFKVRAVAPGAYFWRVSVLDSDDAELFKSTVGSIRVKEGEPAPRKGAVAVFSSHPRGAVYINGKLLGYGAVTARPDPGAVSVVIVAPGYRRFEKNLVLGPGEKRELRAELELLERRPVVKTVEEISPMVRMSTPPGVPLAAKPLVRKNLIITASAGGMITGSPVDGGPGWTANLKSRIESTPVGDEGAVYVATSQGELVKIDEMSGKVAWKKNVDGPVLFSSRPLFAEGNIIVATSFGNVSTFTPKGRLVWKKKLGGGVFCSPSYHGGIVYVGTEDRKLHALRAKDGGEIWKFSMDSRMVASSPLVHRNLVYAGCYSGSFFAVNIGDGSMKWLFKARGPILTSPVAINTMVYFGSLDGRLYALDSDSGRLRWSYNTGQKIMIDPAAVNGKMYLIGEKTFHVVDATGGSLVWKVNFDSPIKTPPSTMGEDVLFGLENGDVVSLNPEKKRINR